VTKVKECIEGTESWAETTYMYDPGDSDLDYHMIGLVSTIVDPRGNHTWIDYYLDGSVAMEVQDLDGDGNRETTTNEDGLVTGSDKSYRRYVYDDRGYKQSEIWQAVENGVDVLRTISYEYNGNGQLTAIQYPDGGQTTYEYNADGTKRSETVVFTTDASGNPLTSGTTVYDYDVLKRVTRITYPDGGEVKYKYDAVGNRIQEFQLMETNKHQLTQYEYDTVGRLTRVWKNLGATELGEDTPIGGTGMTKVSECGYDGNGNKVWERDVRETRTEWSYDAMNRLSSVVVRDGASGSDPVLMRTDCSTAMDTRATCTTATAMWSIS